MGSVFRVLMLPFLKPVTRLIAGVVAVPLCRHFRRRLVKVEEWDEELEKDIDEWFRGAVLLLLATGNVELALVDWLGMRFDVDIVHNWWLAACRLLLAVSVIEAMPDQELFSVIHPGPPTPRYFPELGWWGSVRRQAWPITRGLIAQHLKRSSAVFAIMSVILVDTAGWVCYFLAIAQYLIIGLVTSRDKALDLLAEFDEQMAERRRALIQEFHIDSRSTAADGETPPRRSAEDEPAPEPAEQCEPASG